MANILRTRYGYDPGGLGDIIGATDSDLAFARLDWNAATGHQVTFRHNYLKANRDIIENRNSLSFRFPTSTYTFDDETNSTVLQVNSVFGSIFNEGRLGFQTIRDLRSVPVSFPSVEVGPTAPRAGEVLAGTERFSGVNALDQDVLEITDDVTLLRGNHTITVGTHNEIFEFSNAFLSDAFGYYYFPNTAAFDAGLATQYAITFANTAEQAAGFECASRLYAGDQWRSTTASPHLRPRGDKPSFPTRPTSTRSCRPPSASTPPRCPARTWCSRRASASTGAPAATTSCAAASASSPDARRTCGCPTRSTAPACSAPR